MVRLSKNLINFLPVLAFLLFGIWLVSCTGAPLSNPTSLATGKLDARVEPVSTGTMVDAAIAPTPPPVDTTLNSPTQANLSLAIPISRATHNPPPEFSAILLPENLKPGVSPIPYLVNPCIYLKNRWGAEKSQPGTVVVPIMFHSVVQPGRLITDSTSISMAYFEYFMETAREMGFSTITADELVGFLEENQAIPARSMILILDDRRPGVTELFMPYLEENDWTLTLGWIAADTTRDAVWEKMTELAQTGRLDVQSHGFNHVYIQDYVYVEQIEEELFRPIEVIEARFGSTPIAHIWPGGNYTDQAIEIAGEAGYKIGFTVHSRGPIMFNWIPLGEAEMAMNAPLMLLPRFWSTAAVQALEEAVTVSEQAKAYASAVQGTELAYYAYYCQPAGSE